MRLVAAEVRLQLEWWEEVLEEDTTWELLFTAVRMVGSRGP